MTDLAAALREAGHEDVAAALEKKELAGRLRQNGRDDLAHALEAGGQGNPAAEEEAQRTVEPATPHKRLAQELRNAQSQWFTFGGPGSPGDGKAA
jgi:hypothetical protein